MLKRLQTLWGSGESRWFKLGAWGVAATAFYVHYTYYSDKRPESMRLKALEAATKKD